MAYTKTPWVNGQVALSAENMNHIEQGIYEAHQDINVIDAAIQTEALKEQLLDVIYPVGSIYMSATLDTAAKVAAALGGTWEAWGAGKVPVGVDTSDTDFDTAEETGGEKTVTLTTAQIPAHTHNATVGVRSDGEHQHSVTGVANTVGAHSHGMKDLWSAGAGSVMAYTMASNRSLTERYTNPAGEHRHDVEGTALRAGEHSHSAYATIQATGGGGAHNNLQPYITCYMWKRTA